MAGFWSDVLLVGAGLVDLILIGIGAGWGRPG